MKNLIAYFVLVLLIAPLATIKAQDTIFLKDSYAIVPQKNIPRFIENMDGKTIISPEKVRSFQNALLSDKYKNLIESNHFKNGEIAWKGKLQTEGEIIVGIIIFRNKENIIKSTLFFYLNSDDTLPLKDRHYLTIEVDQSGRFIYCSNCLDNKDFENEYLNIPNKIADLVLQH